MQQRSLLTSKWSKDLSFTEILDLRLLIQKIEQIGDEIKTIVNKILSKEKLIIQKEDLIFLIKKYDESFNAYLRQDSEIAKKFWDTEKSDKKRLSYNQDLVRIYDHIKDITDLVI
jgi:phosphate uptake regulator